MRWDSYGIRRRAYAKSAASFSHTVCDASDKRGGDEFQEHGSWIGFAGILMLIVGSIEFFQGLIALFEDQNFVVTRSGFLVRPDGMGLDQIDLGRAACPRRPRTLAGKGRRAGFRSSSCPSASSASRFSRQQRVSDLVTDCDLAQRDRALLVDRALGRKHVRPHRRTLTDSPGSRPSRHTVRDGLSRILVPA